MNAFEQLASMKGKPFLYRDEHVVILNYSVGAGDAGTEVEIYLNNGKTLVFSSDDLECKLSLFKPANNTVVVLANERLNQVSTINPDVIQNIRDILLEQIKNVKESPDAVPQAKQVFQGVNTLINLARTEIEYRKFLNNQDKTNL